MLRHHGGEDAASGSPASQEGNDAAHDLWWQTDLRQHPPNLNLRSGWIHARVMDPSKVSLGYCAGVVKV